MGNYYLEQRQVVALERQVVALEKIADALTSAYYKDRNVVMSITDYIQFLFIIMDEMKDHIASYTKTTQTPKENNQ